MASKTKSGLFQTPVHKPATSTQRSGKSTKGSSFKSDGESHSPMQIPRLSVDRSSPRSVSSKPTTERRSPRVAMPPESFQKPRISKSSELQAQLTATQDDLKKVKEKLTLAEKEKNQALNELKEAKRHAEEASEKLQEAIAAQKIAEETSEFEKFRAIELEQVGIEASLKKQEEWEKELESLKSQHALDMTAFLTTTQELQKTQQELQVVVDAKNRALSHADDATKMAEIHAEKVDFLTDELARLKGLLESKAESEDVESGIVAELRSELGFLRQELNKAKEIEESIFEKDRYEQRVMEFESEIVLLKQQIEKAKSYEEELIEREKSNNKVVNELISERDSLHRELEVAAGFREKLGRKEELHEELNVELEAARMAESYALKLLDEAECEIATLKEKISLLEISLAKKKKDYEESETRLRKANEEVGEAAKLIESLTSELEVVKEEKSLALEDEKLAASSVRELLEEKNRLINELELLKEEEEKSKEAMESLVSALHEVSAEARVAKEKLLSNDAEHDKLKSQIDHLKLLLETTSAKYERMLEDSKQEIILLEQSKIDYDTQMEDLKVVLKASNDKFESMLDDAKQEIEHLTKMIQQLKLEHQSSKAEWEAKEQVLMSNIKRLEEENSSLDEEKELQLVNVLRRSEEEKSWMEEEITRLKNLLKEAEENARRSLEEAKSEAGLLKEALEEVETERMKLRDSLNEKEKELQKVQKENGEVSDSDKDYDLLPKVVEFSEENGHRAENDGTKDFLIEHGSSDDQVETGENSDHSNGVSSENSTNSDSKLKKKKPLLYRKFGNLLNKGIGNQK